MQLSYSYAKMSYSCYAEDVIDLLCSCHTAVVQLFFSCHAAIMQLLYSSYSTFVKFQTNLI